MLCSIYILQTSLIYSAGAFSSLSYCVPTNEDSAQHAHTVVQHASHNM